MHRARVVGFIGFVALVGSVLGASAVEAAPAWVATATQANPLQNATDLGAASATTPLRVTVALRLRQVSALQNVIRNRQVLSTSQFVASYAPTTAQVQAVTSYLSGNGYTNITTAPNRLLVTANGTVAQAESAFDTHIERFEQHGRNVFANTTAARVPSALGNIVGAVLGLNNTNVMSVHSVLATNPPSSCAISGLGVPCTYNPQGFWRAYDATNAPTGSATNIAIFAEGNLTGVVNDLRAEESANGLPHVPVNIVPVGPASSDTSGAAEWDMDTQYSTGMAGGVQSLSIYDASSLSDADITASFNRFAADNVAKAASASFGECEFAASLGGAMLADDNAFMEAAAQGQSVFASSGDTGGFCPVVTAVNGVPAGAPDANYPASSPWVTSVGGTTLVTNSDGSYGNEIAWLAGGGGPSLFEAAPAYQNGIAPPLGTVCASLAVISCGRGVPDVAMDGDPNSGVNVYVDGQPEGVGGTSLSSPLALGVWARMQSAAGNTLGFANPSLYGGSGSTAYHDIVLGDTGPYPALPGYDYATGIGTFDVAQVIARIG